MARPLRIEYAGALYHITSRGDRREDIYRNNGDREQWLETLSQVCERFNWVVHSYCQMSNHYHLLVETLARHPRYISPWDIHVQRFTPLGRINRGPQYVLRPASTPHKSRSVKTYLTDLTAFREKIFASLACYRTRRIGKFPCGLLRTKNHHFAIAPFP